MMLESLSGPRVLTAVSILLTHLGARYLVLDLDARQDQLFQDPLVRRVVLFCVLFLATRDVLVSGAMALAATFLLEWTRKKD